MLVLLAVAAIGFGVYWFGLPGKSSSAFKQRASLISSSISADNLDSPALIEGVSVKAGVSPVTSTNLPKKADAAPNDSKKEPALPPRKVDPPAKPTNLKKKAEVAAKDAGKGLALPPKEANPPAKPTNLKKKAEVAAKDARKEPALPPKKANPPAKPTNLKKKAEVAAKDAKKEPALLPRKVNPPAKSTNLKKKAEVAAKDPKKEPAPPPRKVMPPSKLSSDALAIYTFDGNANDSSGNGLHLKVQGAKLTSDRNGRPKSAYAFDGNDYMFRDDSAYNIKGPFSISLWFRADSKSFRASGAVAGPAFFAAFMSPGNPVAERKPFGAEVYVLGYSSDVGKPCFGMPGQAAISRDRSTPNQWYHLAGTYDGKQQRLYVNGVLHATNGGDEIGVFGTRFQVGADWDPGSETQPIYNQFLTGAIDDIRIFRVALPIEEIKVLARY